MTKEELLEKWEAHRRAERERVGTMEPTKLAMLCAEHGAPAEELSRDWNRLKSLILEGRDDLLGEANAATTALLEEIAEIQKASTAEITDEKFVAVGRVFLEETKAGEEAMAGPEGEIIRWHAAFIKKCKQGRNRALVSPTGGLARLPKTRTTRTGS